LTGFAYFYSAQVILAKFYLLTSACPFADFTPLLAVTSL